MPNYATTAKLWKSLGEDAYTRVRSEIVGTGDGSTTIFSFDNYNLISGSVSIYTAGTLVPDTEYSLDLDDGKVTFSSAPASIEITADYDYGSIPDSWVNSILEQAEDELEKLTGRKFTYETDNSEYISVETNQQVFYTQNYPIIQINYLSSNTASSVTDEPAWETMVEGLGNDYICNERDKEVGRIRFIDNEPYTGEDRLKINYDYGYTSVPSIIEDLTLLLAQRKMSNSTIYKSIIKGYDGFTPIRLDEIENRINQLINVVRKSNISSI